MTVAEARNKGGVGTAGNEVVIRRDAGERARAGTVAGIKTGTEAGVVRTKPRGLSRTGGVPGWLSAVAAALMAALCALLSYSISRVLTRPLVRLSKVSRAIAKGELSSRADIRTRCV